MSESVRRPPAFQLYASDTLADRRFLLMGAHERGLLLSMRMACWVSDEVPSDPARLARVIGLPADEVAAALTPAVLGYFRPVPGDSGNLHDPELAAQMNHLRERRERQAQGGREGANQTNAQRAAKSGNSSGTTPGKSSGDSSASGRVLSRAEQSRDEQSRTGFAGEATYLKAVTTERDPSLQAWVDEYATAATVVQPPVATPSIVNVRPPAARQSARSLAQTKREAEKRERKAAAAAYRDAKGG